jgi:hypothetical protein
MLMRAQVAMVCLFLLVGCGGGSTNTNTDGASGSGGATGAGGATGNGGATGTGGSSGTATCAQCDKAQACCVAVVGAANCMLSTAACNGLSGQNQMTYAMSCQTILQTGASISVPACL